MSDHYRTIAGRVKHSRKVERSEFLGIAFPIVLEDDFFVELGSIQKEHFDATHHCWAFRLFAGSRSRSSDAGEPSGTAGKPILNAIEGAALHDVGLVVVRWFGGVKLGTGGLSRAYRDSAAEALGLVTAVDRYLYQTIRVTVPFDALSTVYRLVHPPDVLLAGEAYGEVNEFTFNVRASLVSAFTRALDERRLAWASAPSASLRAGPAEG